MVSALINVVVLFVVGSLVLGLLPAMPVSCVFALGGVGFYLLDRFVMKPHVKPLLNR